MIVGEVYGYVNPRVCRLCSGGRKSYVHLRPPSIISYVIIFYSENGLCHLIEALKGYVNPYVCRPCCGGRTSYVHLRPPSIISYVIIFYSENCLCQLIEDLKGYVKPYTCRPCCGGRTSYGHLRPSSIITQWIGFHQVMDNIYGEFVGILETSAYRRLGSHPVAPSNSAEGLIGTDFGKPWIDYSRGPKVGCIRQ